MDPNATDRDFLLLLLRVVASLVLAPLVPALVLSVAILRNPIWGLGACLFVCPVTVVIGTPIYFVLRPRVAPTWRNAALAGGVAAALPAIWLAAIAEPAWESESYGFKTAVDHAFTVAGRVEQLILIAAAFAVGASGGLVFKRVVEPGPRRPPP